ncbi:MAG TPA: glucose-6-phosphate isomerase [Anaerohalosphaeraceae bacterium]|nr:glucose-6-phosphate isomerase [Anaerohalosphaeraceae bacterium]HRT52146.1 glucose-6-phosphate isomerase [Anaerohalosphaeraceae bacterium]HRT86627.1 glucose-6-phosphate isomerase [Anaerohalosphaeraceae bacterium]
MLEPKVSLYYKNVTAERIGVEHGITESQFAELGEKAAAAVEKVNADRAAGRIPYRDLPYREDYAARAKEVAGELADKCDVFVVLGIGGSALGNIALQTALNPYMYNVDPRQRKGPQFFVFDNVDPAQFGSFLEWAADRLDRTYFNVISKSGQTAETAAQFMIVRQMLLEKYGPAGAKEHIIATTDAASGTMRKITDAEGYRSLVVPDGVGGRFSVLSPVGLLSAAVCGIDIDGLLAGARAMDERVSGTEFRRNPAAINAAIQWHYYWRGKPISVMMPYAYALKDLADWYRQLWAESLGKAKDLTGAEVNVGPTPVKALGTTDQHSQVQLYREGPNDKVFTFLQAATFERDLEIAAGPEIAPELGYLAGRNMSTLLNAEKLATEYALFKMDRRPCLTVMFDEVNASTIGQFLYLYEVTTSIAGALFGINTYEQPAVELGKKATFALMGREGYADLAREIEPYRALDTNFLV